MILTTVLLHICRISVSFLFHCLLDIHIVPFHLKWYNKSSHFSLLWGVHEDLCSSLYCSSDIHSAPSTCNDTTNQVIMVYIGVNMRLDSGAAQCYLDGSWILISLNRPFLLMAWDPYDHDTVNAGYFQSARLECDRLTSSSFESRTFAFGMYRTRGAPSWGRVSG